MALNQGKSNEISYRECNWTKYFIIRYSIIQEHIVRFRITLILCTMYRQLELGVLCNIFPNLKYILSTFMRHLSAEMW